MSELDDLTEAFSGAADELTGVMNMKKQDPTIATFRKLNEKDIDMLAKAYGEAAVGDYMKRMRQLAGGKK